VEGCLGVDPGGFEVLGLLEFVVIEDADDVVVGELDHLGLLSGVDHLLLGEDLAGEAQVVVRGTEADAGLGLELAGLELGAQVAEFLELDGDALLEQVPGQQQQHNAGQHCAG
jgi:hypothetical protein